MSKYLDIMSHEHMICALRENGRDLSNKNKVPSNSELDFILNEASDNSSAEIDIADHSDNPVCVAKTFMKQYKTVEGVYNQISKTVYKQEKAKRSISLII